MAVDEDLSLRVPDGEFTVAGTMSAGKSTISRHDGSARSGRREVYVKLRM